VNATSVGIVCALSAVWAVVAQQPPRDAQESLPRAGTATISGAVTTASPVPRSWRPVRVTLTSVDGSVPARTTTCDDAGRFAFQGLPAGRFDLSASRPGFLTSRYGARRPDRAGTPIVLKDGQNFAGVTLRMTRGGAITGIVRDQSGQPVPGLSVTVLRYGYSSLTGERTLSQYSSSGSGLTDDRGVYRAWGLPPGDFVVMAALVPTGRGGPPGLEDMRRLTAADVDRAIATANTGGSFRNAGQSIVHPALGPTMNYAPIFYPGTTDITAATTVTLGAGEERGGVDLGMQLLATARIEGAVRLPEGMPPEAIGLTLAASGAQAELLGPSARTTSTRLDRDGRFAFAGVAPGRYTITAKAGAVSTGRESATGTVTQAGWWAMSDVVVAGHDLTIALDLQPPMTLSGHVRFEGTSAPPPSAGLRIALVPPGSGGNLSAGPPGGQVDDQGTFVFTSVTPGTYWPAVLWNVSGASGWAITTSVANGRDALDAPIDIKPGEHVDWEITYGDRPSELHGTLEDASGRAATDYFVVVFPTDKSRWLAHSRRIRNTRPATDGTFSIVGLPAGEYFVAALTDLEPGEWNDPSFLSSITDASIKITLSEGVKTTQDLRLAGGGD
jgi:hypothetical protein